MVVRSPRWGPLTVFFRISTSGAVTTGVTLRVGDHALEPVLAAPLLGSGVDPTVTTVTTA